jgi:hypothetical protein
MSFSYKLRLTPTPALSSSIQKNAVEIAKSRLRIKTLNAKLKISFAKLKKLNAELTKLAAKTVKLKEKNPRLRDRHRKQREAVKDLSAEIRQDIVIILKEIESIASDLKKIIFDADTILYRENKALERFNEAVKKLDKKTAAKISAQIRVLKEELKTTARRLYESVSTSGFLKKPFSKKFEVSSQIAKLSSEAASLETVLERLRISRIEDIAKKAEKELADLRKIEIAAISLIPELKAHLSRIRNDIYILEPSFAGRIENNLNTTATHLAKTVYTISKQAEKLFEEIVIVKKIK